MFGEKPSEAYPPNKSDLEIVRDELIERFSFENRGRAVLIEPGISEVQVIEREIKTIGQM